MSKYLNDIDVKSSVGVVCKSKSFGDFKIVSYSDSKNVLIEFINTWFLAIIGDDDLGDGGDGEQIFEDLSNSTVTLVDVPDW